VVTGRWYNYCSVDRFAQVIHNDIGSLRPSMQEKTRRVLAEMNADPQIRALGVEGVALGETLRELPVQMAYRSRGLWESVKNAIPQEQVIYVKNALATYAQDMYKAAGLYSLSTSQAVIPNTWTLNSRHLSGAAFDIRLIKNKVEWWPPKDHPVWPLLGAIGEKYGLAWGGRWKNTDSPHFEEV